MALPPPTRRCTKNSANPSELTAPPPSAAYEGRDAPVADLDLMRNDRARFVTEVRARWLQSRE